MRGRIDTLPHGTWTDHPPTSAAEFSSAVEKSAPRRSRDVSSHRSGAIRTAAHGHRSRTGPVTTDGVCRVLCRASVLVVSAYDTSDTVILTSI